MLFRACLHFLLFYTALASLSGVFDVRDFGAIGDGILHNNTAAINAAIAAASEYYLATNNIGIVLIVDGTYFSGRIVLLSGVTLSISHGAVLSASSDYSDYTDENGVIQFQFVHSSYVHDIEISGGGVIEGNYQNFIDGFSEEDDKFSPGHMWPQCEGEECRPKLVVLENTQNILIKNITFQNSPDWTFHLVNCSYVHVVDWTQYGDERWPNNDAIDIDSSSHVLVENSQINTADDGVCIKGGVVGAEVFNVTVRNTKIRSRSSAIKFGSNCPIPMHDLLFEDIDIWDSNRGLAIQARDGGRISDVTFRRISILGTRYWPWAWWGEGSPIYISTMLRSSDADPGTQVNNITFSDIFAISQNAAILSGISPGLPVDGVLLSNVTIVITRLPGWNYSTTSDPSIPPNIDYEPTSAIDPIRKDLTGWMPGLLVETVKNLVLSNVSVLFKGAKQSYWGTECFNFTAAGYDVTTSNIKCEYDYNYKQ